MNAIINHIVNMAPYMLLAFVIHLFCRIAIIKKKKSEPNFHREGALLFFTVFLVGLASQAILPKITFGADGVRILLSGTHRTNLIPFNFLYEMYCQVVLEGNWSYFWINFLGNVIMFVPIGLFVPLLWNTSAKQTVLCGFFCSLLIEFTQLFMPRSTDVDDLVLNTLGSFSGWLLYQLISAKFPTLINKFRK